MLKISTLSGAILALISTTVSAQVEDRWHYVGRTDEHQWFLDKRSVDSGSKDYPDVNAWTLVNNIDTSEKRLIEMAINCQSMTVRMLSHVSTQNGKTYHDTVDPTPMKRPIPGTLLEDVVDAVCE